MTRELDDLCITTIRTLCIDAIEAANSGHPGTPVGIAPVTYTLWQRFLRFDPSDPIWPNRDRFVLSAGHASALLWSLLYLTGVRSVDPEYEILGEPAVSLDDLKRFRQLGSKCPGHPEYRWTSGVETTSGPLGQGVATSVGMAVASQWLGARYNRDGFTLFDFDVYAQAGDGCMMEGVASEAASFAAHQRLSNLCWIYDANRVTIEGHTDLTFTEDVAARFAAYGWNVTTIADANDLEAAERAFAGLQGGGRAADARRRAQPHRLRHARRGHAEGARRAARPRGREGGEALLRLARGRRVPRPRRRRRALRRRHRRPWPRCACGVGGAVRGIPRSLPRARGRGRAHAAPRASRRLGRWPHRVPRGREGPRHARLLGPGAERGRGARPLARRRRSRPRALDEDAPDFDGAGDFAPADRSGRNFHFGVREFASAAIANGLALSKLRPFWSGFLIFSDYARGAIRLSALMEIPVVHIFTHDSIGVGEDGPTHQPVEQLASLRAMPGLLVFRPADANEVLETWRYVMQLHHEPAVLVLSRQALPTLDRSVVAAPDIARGAYVLADTDGEPDVILVATGSEVSLALAARDDLAADGIGARVVSMPCSELFDRQPQSYRDEVLPPAVKARVAIEQASALGWARYVGDGGAIVAMNTFGASAPLKQLVEKFGFTPDAVSDVAREVVAR